MDLGQPHISLQSISLGGPTNSDAYLVDFFYQKKGRLPLGTASLVPTVAHTHEIFRIVLKSVHFEKPVTRSSFLSKSVVIFNITTTNLTTLFERNEDRVKVRLTQKVLLKCEIDLLKYQKLHMDFYFQ